MKELLFIDTGAFYSRYVVSDDYHQESLRLWQRIREEGIRCFTSNFVLSELITLLIYRFGIAKALQPAREIYASRAIQIVPVSLENELSALERLEKFSDQDFSMTDAVSFAVMEEKKLKQAFTFDHHFDIAGFERFSFSS